MPLCRWRAIAALGVPERSANKRRRADATPGVDPRGLSLNAMPTTRLSHLTAAWGVIFALVHAYWAAGGPIGMDGDPADGLAVQLYVGFIALIGLATLKVR